MKRTILLGLLLITETACFSQQIEQKDTLSPKTLMRRGRTQQAFGWVFITGGSFVLTGTLIAVVVTTQFDLVTAAVGGKPEKRSFGLPLLASLGSTIVGVVLVSKGAKNKRMARDMSTSLKMESLPALHNTQMVTS